MTTAGEQSRDDPFRWLLDTAATLVSSSVDDTGLHEIARTVGKAMNVPAIDIEIFDPATDSLTVAATWSPGESDVGDVTPLSETPNLRRIIAGRRTEELQIDDALLSAREKENLVSWGYTVSLITPLVMGDEVLGLLEASETRFDRRFLSIERERFTQLAGLVANAIYNGRAYQRYQRQGRRLEALLAVSAALTQVQNPGGALVAGVAALADGVEASWAALFEAMHDGDTPPERVVSHAAPEHMAVPSRSSIRQGIDPVVVRKGDSDAHSPVVAEMLADDECARLYLPLGHRGAPVGLLVLAWRGAQSQAEEADIEFTRAAGGLLAAALTDLRPGGAAPR